MLPVASQIRSPFRFDYYYFTACVFRRFYSVSVSILEMGTKKFKNLKNSSDEIGHLTIKVVVATKMPALAVHRSCVSHQQEREAFSS